MNRRTILASIVGCLPLVLCAAPKARLVFHVVDDNGNAITNTTVILSAYASSSPGEPVNRKRDRIEMRGATDTNGMVALEISSTSGDLYYRVAPQEKPSVGGLPMRLGDGRVYYMDWGSTLQMTAPVDNKWQPWGSTVKVVERPVLNPIPMYARSTGQEYPPLKLPELENPIGFDLAKSDWVAPYGKGMVPDFVFYIRSSDSAIPKEYYEEFPRSFRYKDMVAQITFVNMGDGIQCVLDDPQSGGSVFRLPRYAPESGYESNLVRVSRVVFNGRSPEYQGDPAQGHPNQNYIFRVRSQRDQNGAITNALYGKIRGPIGLNSGGFVSFTYYLNPKPNDRNLEYDASHNLLKDALGYREAPPPGP